MASVDPGELALQQTITFLWHIREMLWLVNVAHLVSWAFK